MAIAAVAATDPGPAVSAAAARAKGTHTVVIEAMRFNPQDLTVKAGDTVVWINHDPFPHTVTAAGGRLDSHEIAAGRSWKYVAKEAGVLAYACTLHPNMSGTLRVE